ncbi:hypothetical protein E2C01_030230 [Portunus trituberculatus]|uniref:Uncharacterized protein n=1 Tax=Portunus trituberculatus TaxID=210409 RepID=A0A5B7ERI8_PORTR|nr:hypothetical protein [Portunus trituberculatus]
MAATLNDASSLLHLDVLVFDGLLLTCCSYELHDHCNSLTSLAITMGRFHILSAYYLVILNSFRNSCGGIEIVKTVAINLLTSIDPMSIKMVNPPHISW